MRDDRKAEILKKYREGSTSLNEEEELFAFVKRTESPIGDWATFKKKSTSKSPENFNELSWGKFENRRNKKKKRHIGIFSAAASILLIFSILKKSSNTDDLNFSEKEILLNHALSMVSESQKIEKEKRVLFEDELLIIYTISQ